MNPVKNTLLWSAILAWLATNVAFGQIPNETDLSNTNSYYYNLLSGKQKSDKGDFDGAIILLTKAIKLKPDDIDAYSYRGQAKYEKGDYTGAIDDFTKVIELKPDEFDPYMYRGFAKERSGDHDGAIADYTKIIRHEQGPTVLLDGAYYNRGCSKKAKGDLEGAAADFNKLLELKPGGFFATEAQKELDDVKKLIKK